MEIEEELEEFKRLDPEEKAKEIFALFGVAIYYSQVLEQNLINMIAVFHQVEDEITEVDKIDSLWEKYDKGKRTFGILLNELKTKYQVSVEDFDELSQILKIRNYLAHNYFRFNSDLVYSDSGQIKVASDFLEFKYRFKEMDSKLEVYSQKYFEKLGVTQEVLMKELEKYISMSTEKKVDSNLNTLDRN